VVVYVTKQRGIQGNLYMNLRWYRDRFALYIIKYVKGFLYLENLICDNNQKEIKSL